MRMAMAVIAVVLAALLVASFALTAHEPESGYLPVETMLRRVEDLRGLRFRQPPEPERVTREQARREGLADFDRAYAARRRHADEALYTLLGLLPPGTDLRRVSSSIFGDAVAGYYDPRSKRLRIVEGASGNRVTNEMIIAHELTHALEDQVIRLDLDAAEDQADRGYAYRALVEGTATRVMYAYVERHFRSDVALGGLIGGAFSDAGTGDLPQFVVAGLLFPYVQGEAFVNRLHRLAGNRWTLVDLAERRRPPASTEQILHPAKWVRVEAPQRVRIGDLGLGAGYRRLTAGTFGEWQTSQLLSLSGTQKREAAAGWGGDRYELWRRGSEPCDAPCPERDVLALRWRWDTVADAAEFLAALRAMLEDGIEAEPAGDSAWRLRGAGIAVGVGPREAALAFAPSVALARRVAAVVVT